MGLLTIQKPCENAIIHHDLLVKITVKKTLDPSEFYHHDRARGSPEAWEHPWFRYRGIIPLNGRVWYSGEWNMISNLARVWFRWVICFSNLARDLIKQYWLVVSNMAGLFSIMNIWDVIPTPLTNSIIFQRGRLKPPTSMIIYPII